jgi:hypothetical protein
MLAFSDVVYFFADELAGLRARRFPLTFVLRRPPLRFCVRHHVLHSDRQGDD